MSKEDAMTTIPAILRAAIAQVKGAAA